MSYLLLIPFFIFFIIYIIYSKSDLYAHEHDTTLKEELDNFDTNFRTLDNLEVQNKYYMKADHVYNK
ncbi:hypothetical protein [Winogradskyella bathintestinalis]|uniref:Uncharacterized protein n=1 Tax=Winogradskyella bathintestinalis TaxID=3035208 RepID=A0ABT7ZW86_9FLAO|nr:hypothetical protein [Winogradskyella bathintestinalis]MDN3493276.1 hypothetical protein [Winogradskyella bathintestinalis]